MSNLYDSYFATGDIYDGLARLLYARKRNKISDKNLCLIADKLFEEGKIEASSKFERKSWWAWNEKYVSFLMNGMSTGKVSRDYLKYYSEVRRGVTLKKYLGCALAIIAVAICVIAVWKAFS